MSNKEAAPSRHSSVLIYYSFISPYRVFFFFRPYITLLRCSDVKPFLSLIVF